ncbi:hypothetical protein HMPREF3213_01321 [Heyndrickxia coagulans]|uniref:Uncharacterized protein n=1 Tax=Heyndrickxia coagulans TaxID=1398 RepID=A0A133KUS4_HEYCO|nr:hypothetical protein HMPREF3213_01321 [Heyndrickxia coagulans]
MDNLWTVYPDQWSKVVHNWWMLSKNRIYSLLYIFPLYKHMHVYKWP